MATESKDVIEKDELSLPKSIEVDEIINFYKEKEPDFDDAKTEDISESEADNDIITTVYGLSEKGRMYLYRGISLTISVIIIVASFVLAYFLPGNETVIKERESELRAEKEYTSLKSRHKNLKKEVIDLRKSNKEKKSKLEKISDFDNTKAELSAKITLKEKELSELNAQISEKRAKIAELDANIDQKAPPENILPPGKYIIGKNIAAGKYTVTGTGKFMVATSDGKSKINTTLGSTPLEVILDSGDIVKFDSKVKFTSSN